MFQKPTVVDLRQAAQKLGMNPSDAYLNAVEQIITPLANAYATLDTTPDELPAVKYPRGPFYRPSAEENPHGAWYMKTSIKGKPGGKLAGRRVALKDNVCLAGVPMMVGGNLAGRLVLTAGLGGMGGAQPLAATMNGAAFLGIEVNPARIERRLHTA